jgi:hypothetical protein
MTLAINVQRKRKTENELSARELERQQKEEELKQERLSRDDYERKYTQAMKIYEDYINSVPCSLFAPGIFKFQLTDLANTASISRPLLF